MLSESKQDMQSRIHKQVCRFREHPKAEEPGDPALLCRMPMHRGGGGGGGRRLVQITRAVVLSVISLRQRSVFFAGQAAREKFQQMVR